MIQRRTGPIPLARWLTSSNSDLREKAETALYHLGPDAGKALLHAAEQESKWSQQRRVLFLLPVEIAATTGAYYTIRTFVEVQSTLLWILVCYIAIRAIWKIAEGSISRRARLRTVALALARRNDLRSIGPMIDVWRPVGFFGWQIHDDAIEHELSRLLPRFMSQNRLTLRSDKLSLLRGKVRLLTPTRALYRRDLSDDRTDLLITLLQLFARTGGEKNRAVLRRVARLSDSTSNSQLVRDSADVLLTVVATTSSEPATVATSPVRATGSTPSAVAHAAPVSISQP